MQRISLHGALPSVIASFFFSFCFVYSNIIFIFATSKDNKHRVDNPLQYTSRPKHIFIHSLFIITSGKKHRKRLRAS